MTDWQDMIVGDRMTVDGEFAPRVENSQFTRQEWGLIMTATEFEIKNPGDEESATLVANTDELRTMMPEIEKVAQMDPMGGHPDDESDSGRGIVDSILGSLGLSSDSDGGISRGVDEDKLQAAKDLVDDYASELQTHLEADSRWEKVRTAAAEQATEE